jgi:Protein of unknown function (DUF2971)
MAAPMLYHYTTHAGAIGIATKKVLWATSIRHLNDATEFTYAHEVLSQALANAFAQTPFNGSPAALEVMQRPLDVSQRDVAAAFTGTLGSTFIVSFSADRDKLSQWRTYCPGGGYALGFRVDVLQEIAKAAGFTLIQCSYDPVIHSRQAGALAEEVRQRVEAALAPVTFPISIIQLQIVLTLIRRYMEQEIQALAPSWKHSSFHEEEEWRLVSPRGLDPNRKVEFRVGRSAIIPYATVPLDKPTSMLLPNGTLQSIAEIHVGPCPEPALSLMTVMHLFGVNQFMVSSYSHTATPYRQW